MSRACLFRALRNRIAQHPGDRTVSIQEPKSPGSRKRYVFSFFFFPFCFNSLTNSTWKYNYNVEERWQTTAFAVIEQKRAEPAGSWPLRPHGERGWGRDRTWWHLRGDRKFIYNHRPPLGQSGPRRWSNPQLIRTRLRSHETAPGAHPTCTHPCTHTRAHTRAQIKYPFFPLTCTEPKTTFSKQNITQLL